MTLRELLAAAKLVRPEPVHLADADDFKALELFFADGATETTEHTGEPKLVWKVVLRTGTWKLRPGPGGVKLAAPLKVFRDEAPKGHLSLTSLKTNFDAKAVEYPTVPLSHGDGTAENTGYVRKLQIEDLEDGQARLWAGIEFTEPDVALKVERRSIASVSAGVLFDYERTEDGAKFDQVLQHVCLTNKPWINGTGEFTTAPPETVMASEDATSTQFGELEPAAEEPPEDDPPAGGDALEVPKEKPAEPATPVKEPPHDVVADIQTVLDRYRGAHAPAPEYTAESVDGDSVQIAAAIDGSTYRWKANFTRDEQAVHLAPFKQWELTEQPQQREVAPRTISPPPVTLAGMTLAKAKQHRINHSSNPTGGSVSLRDLLAGANLSEEQLAAIEQQEALLAQFQTTGKKAEADSYVETLKGLGLDQPGLLAFVHGALMSDDGGPAIELSEEVDGRRTAPQALTATELLKGFIDRLPKQEDGKVTLSQQARRLPNEDPRPPAEPETNLSAQAKDVDEAKQRSGDFLKEAAELGLSLSNMPVGA
jgi:hypothetical protein